MEKFILKYAGFTKTNKEIYFVFNSNGESTGKMIESKNIEIVTEKLKNKGFKVIIEN